MRRRLAYVLAAAVVLLVAARLWAPVLVRQYLNDALADIGDYQGHVEDVDLALWRGAYTLHGMTIRKVEPGIETPLLEAPRLLLSVQWDALFNGELVGEAHFASPAVHFVRQQEASQYGEGPDWRDTLESLFPVHFNRITVTGGSLHFHDTTSDPAVEVFLSDVDATVANLTNIHESGSPAPTGVQATATAMGHAPLELQARLDPWAEQPRFDLNFDLRELELTRLNPFLEAYVNVTAEAGTFSLSAEVAAADGAYEGYVKPLLDHAAFIRPSDFRERPLGALWETVVAAFAELFENQPRDRIGTRVPLQGEFGPEPDVLAAIGGVFRNMFDAFLQGVEGSVELRDALEEAR